MHKKQTYLWIGHFTALSVHFLANYINIFHKIELQMIILMFLKCLNLIWIKIYNIKHISFISCFFYQFVRKNTKNLWLINGLGTISGHFFANYLTIFHKKEVKTVILRCLVCLNPNWIKSCDIILVFFMPENALFQGYFTEVSFGTFYGNQLSYFHNCYFSKKNFVLSLKT